jgi:hypothetical protein
MACLLSKECIKENLFQNLNWLEKSTYEDILLLQDVSNISFVKYENKKYIENTESSLRSIKVKKDG